MTKELDSFAARMRVARKSKQMTQEELADAAGVSAETISNLERAKFLPTFDVLTAVMKTLDINPLDVFQSPKVARKVSARRLEQEAMLQHISGGLDDHSMTLLVEIAAAIQKTLGK
jgi:transcriptional regulator with XRE-family HTH domain